MVDTISKVLALAHEFVEILDPPIADTEPNAKNVPYTNQPNGFRWLQKCIKFLKDQGPDNWYMINDDDLSEDKIDPVVSPSMAAAAHMVVAAAHNFQQALDTGVAYTSDCQTDDVKLVKLAKRVRRLTVHLTRADYYLAYFFEEVERVGKAKLHLDTKV